ncbi:MAG: PEP-CTERM sorting domain-containing protein [Rubrivivax sp.]|nr:MAG: PEP-CTERM sorting domain-containing protein [Rubrivivax sp.]
MAAALAAVSAFTAPAFAAPVSYSFGTNAQAFGNADIISLLNATTGVSGSFQYNSASPLYGQSGNLGFESGYSVYIGTNANNLAFRALQGNAGGHLFSDVLGSANVANNNPNLGGADTLSLIADSTVPAGANTPSKDSYPLTGFTVGGYKLNNVRLFWVAGQGSTGAFLNDNSLPGALPGTTGRLALDFVRTDDPTNQAGRPFYANTVFFDGLTVHTATATVPEPATCAMLLAGLVAVGAWGRQRKASQTKV